MNPNDIDRQTRAYTTYTTTMQSEQQGYKMRVMDGPPYTEAVRRRRSENADDRYAGAAHGRCKLTGDRESKTKTKTLMGGASGASSVQSETNKTTCGMWRDS